MTSYREPLFQIGTVHHEGDTYESTTYLSADSDMGMAGTPHLTADLWGGLRPDTHEQVRIWLNREQWAELAAFAAQMATDERVPMGDEREDVRYFNQAQLTKRVEAKRAALLQQQKDDVLVYLQSLLDMGQRETTLALMVEASFEVMDALEEEGLVTSRIPSDTTREHYSLTIKGRKVAKALQEENK